MKNKFMLILTLFSAGFLAILAILRTILWNTIQKRKIQLRTIFSNYGTYIIYFSFIILITRIILEIQSTSLVGSALKFAPIPILIIFITYNGYLSILEKTTNPINKIIRTFSQSIKHIHKLLLVFLTIAIINIIIISVLKLIIVKITTSFLIGLIIYYILGTYLLTWSKLFIYNSTRPIYEK